MVSEKKITPEFPITEDERKLLGILDGKKDELTELLQKMVKIDSRNYSETIFNDRTEIFTFTEQYMKEAGFEAQLYPAKFSSAEDEQDGKDLYYQNLIITFDGQKSGKTLQFNGHLDIVPFNEDKWNPETPPLGGIIKEGKLYGRGASDMKAGVACMLMAMKVLKEGNAKFNGKLQTWCVPDEETHGVYGSAFMIKNHFDKVNADATIISEPSGVKPLESPAFGFGEKGPHWLKLTFFGAAGHGSMPKPNSNAFRKAVRFVSNSKKLKFPKQKAPTSMMQLLKSILNRYKIFDLPKLLKGFGEIDKNPYDEDGISFKSINKNTISFNKINAGSAVNVIPNICDLEVDIRALPGVSTQGILSSIANYATKLNYKIDLPEKYENPQNLNEKIKKRPVDIKLSIITRAEGSTDDINSEFGQLLVKSFKAIYEVAPVTFFSPGFTDAGNMREGGMKDIFIIGPSGSGAHDINEYVDLDSLINATKVYLLTAYRFLK
ncbi:MAG: M20 family metallopeptidase [archaeon]|nr:M20 family metallopeptidase [archaeon]